MHDDAPVRNGYLDAVRVLGIIAVVLGHIESLDVVRGLVYPWHVPLFFIMSGWFWRVGRDLGHEVRSRWRTLARPYLAWFVVVSVVYVGVVAVEGGDPARALVGPLAGGAHAVQPYSAYWFISALAVSAVAARLLEVVGLPLWAQCVVGVVLCGAVQLAPAIAAESPLAIAQGLGCVIYVQAGMLLRRLPASAGGAAAALASGVALAALPGVRALDLKVADFGTPVLSLLASVLICAGLVMAPIRLEGRAARAASLLAGAGLAVILGHALVLWLWLDVVPTPALAIIALVLPWAVGLVLARTRWRAAFGCTTPISGQTPARG